MRIVLLIAGAFLLMGTKCGRHIFIQSYEAKDCFDNSSIKPTGELKSADFFLQDRDIKISEAKIARTECNDVYSPVAKLSPNIVTQCFSISYKMADPKNIWGAVFDAKGLFAIANLPNDDSGKKPKKVAIVDSTGGAAPGIELMAKIFEQNEKFLATGIFGENCMIPVGEPKVITETELVELFEAKK